MITPCSAPEQAASIPIGNEAAATLHVACVADAGYGAYAGITLASVIRSNPGLSVHLHVFSDSIRAKDLQRIARLAAENGAGCSFYDVASRLDNFPVLKGKFHYSRAAYGRLFIAELLPADVEFVLYLDCDIVCVAALDDLWSLRERIAVAGAVLDIWVNQKPDYKQRVGCSAGTPYFNSGVMLMNVRAWRARKLFEALIEYINSSGLLRYADQDAINGVLGPEIFELEPRWNVFISAPDLSQVHIALESAANIHFCSGLKPWHLGYSLLGGLAAHHFKEVKAATPWKWKLPDLHFGRMKKKAVTVYRAFSGG